MKRLMQFLTLLFGLSLALNVQAQKRDDSKYLAGAVPEVDGKVVFTKEYSIPGMSKEEVFQRAHQWMETRMKQNENISRVVLTDEEKGLIVAVAKEWIVFSSTALALDRTEISYQLTAVCQPEHCTLEVEKIRYSHREGEEKYVAEEWITDKYALNKKKTKLVIGLAKWRRKTVDFVDDLAKSLAGALSIAPQMADQSQETVNDQVSLSGPTIITSQPRPVKKEVELQAVPVAAVSGYEEVAPDQLSSDLIQMGSGKLVIVIGTDEFNQTMMTANAGGSLGKMSGKTVVFSLLSPEQPYEQMEGADTYAVRFYPTGSKAPSLILECRKLPSQAPLEGQPRMYVGEVLKAQVKSASR